VPVDIHARVTSEYRIYSGDAQSNEGRRSDWT
jgi:hypothetical protein